MAQHARTPGHARQREESVQRLRLLPRLCPRYRTTRLAAVAALLGPGRPRLARPKKGEHTGLGVNDDDPPIVSWHWLHFFAFCLSPMNVIGRHRFIGVHAFWRDHWGHAFNKGRASPPALQAGAVFRDRDDDLSTSGSEHSPPDQPSFIRRTNHGAARQRRQRCWRPALRARERLIVVLEFRNRDLPVSPSW